MYFLKTSVFRPQVTAAGQGAALLAWPPRLLAGVLTLGVAGGVMAENAAVPASATQERFEFAGLIEVEAGHVSPGLGKSETDLRLATFAFDVTARVNDWVKAKASVLYEQDETDLEIDEATITLAHFGHSAFGLVAGRFYLPFGRFESNLVSDPLTLELGETRRVAVQLAVERAGFTGSVYTFRSEHDIDGEERSGGWGAMAGYGAEITGGAWNVVAGYINDLTESKTLAEYMKSNRAGADPTRRAGGWTLAATLEYGPFNLYGEYLAALARIAAAGLDDRGRGVRPAAWNLELGYRVSLFAREATLAVAYQGTREALGVALPRQRWLLGAAIEVFKNTIVALEWARDEDYARREGGSGRSAAAVTAQLAVAF